MSVFKIVVNDPKTRKSYQIEVDQSKASSVIGKKIGDEFEGDMIGLSAGYMLQIRGGTDKDGFPMHPDLKGQVKKKLLLSSKPGFHPPAKGQRRRKMVRGNTVSPEIVQLNVKVVKSGAEPLDKLLPHKKKEGKEKKEKPKEEVKEQPKEKTPEKPKVEEKSEAKTEEKPKQELKPEKKEEPKKEESGGGEVKE